MGHTSKIYILINRDVLMTLIQMSILQTSTVSIQFQDAVPIFRVKTLSN